MCKYENAPRGNEIRRRKGGGQERSSLRGGKPSMLFVEEKVACAYLIRKAIFLLVPVNKCQKFQFYYINLWPNFVFFKIGFMLAEVHCAAFIRA